MTPSGLPGGASRSRARVLSGAGDPNTRVRASVRTHDTSRPTSGADVVRLLVRYGFSRVPGRFYPGLSAYDYRVGGAPVLSAFVYHDLPDRWYLGLEGERGCRLDMGDVRAGSPWSLAAIEALVVEAIEAAEGRA